MSHSGGGLRSYVLTRVALAIPTVLILLTMVFLLMRVAPGNPIRAALGARLPAAELEKREAAAGYDKPILEQYGEYLAQVATLDLGETLTDNREVTSILTENGAATLELTLAAFLVTIVVGIGLGLLAGRLPRQLDRPRQPPLRDRHLRGAGLLPRLPGPAARGQRRLADVRSNRHDRRARSRPDTPISSWSTRSSPATGRRSGTCSSTSPSRRSCSG